MQLESYHVLTVSVKHFSSFHHGKLPLFIVTPSQINRAHVRYIKAQRIANKATAHKEAVHANNQKLPRLTIGAICAFERALESEVVERCAAETAFRDWMDTLDRANPRLRRAVR